MGQSQRCPVASAAKASAKSIHFEFDTNLARYGTAGLYRLRLDSISRLRKSARIASA